LKYLELHGLSLRPDLVLFYHELNDYLPSALRDSSNTEIGVRQTDREQYESRMNYVFRSLMNVSALFRFLESRYAYWSVKSFNQKEFDNPIMEIGLPDIPIPKRLVRVENDRERNADLNESALGRRVSDEERLSNLESLVKLCKEHEIALVIIHPSYLPSTRHECLLTRFCKDRGVWMYDAFDALHPANLAVYLDIMHPNVVGHERLAEGLAKFLITNRIIPEPTDRYPASTAERKPF